MKNKSFSLITVFGLSIGMTAFLFIVHYVRFERSYEDFHKNADDIVRLTLDFYKGSEYVVTDCETHAGIGPLVKEKMPEVEDYVRLFHNDGLKDVRVGNRKFLADGIYYTDQSVFSVFTLVTLKGDAPNALTKPDQVVLTASTARTYFGKTDVIGQPVDVDGHTYFVTAIIQDLPPNTHLKFNTLLSHPTFGRINDWYRENEWNGNNEYTYLQLKHGTSLIDFNKKLSGLTRELGDKLNDNKYTAQYIKEIHLLSNKTYEPEPNGNAKIVNFLIVIAAFIILIAWVNYVNLSTARAIERAREVGIRKVMGSVKAQLIFQFLSESLMLNLLSGVIALLLFHFMLPAFRDLTGQPLSLSPMTQPGFWYIFATLILAGTLLSGIYPAFVLSSFQPAAVLKGKFNSSAHGQLLRKGLVVFQFGATVILMVCLCTVYLQIDYLRSVELGMNIDQTLSIRAPTMENSNDSVFKARWQVFKTELLRNSSVKQVMRSGSLPGISLHELSSTKTCRLGDEKKGSYDYYFFSVDADFIPAMDMKMVTGRNFENGLPNDDEVIINEVAVQRLGFRNPEEAIGSKITFQTRWPGQPATIIGVVKNFYQRSPKEAHIPMLFEFGNYANYFSVKLNTQNMKAALTDVEKAWHNVYPDALFSYFFLNEKYGQQFDDEAKFERVIATFSILAVLIACLGLFGLSSYTMLQRTKEIGVRKVLGASVSQIVRLLSKEFMMIVLIAALVATPVAYIAMKIWLSGYAIRVSMNGWIFIFPVLIIGLIALFTVSFQTVKTALANPVNSLKQE